MRLANGLATGEGEALRSPIGRAVELDRLDAHLDSLEAGDPVFLEIVGEPGIGKTTLLGALRQRADNRGMLVLAGRASQFELETPFDPFVDALDDYLASVNPRRFEPLGEERVGELAAAFPSLAVLAESPRILPTEERYRVHRSVRALLSLIGAAKRLVLIVDDAHWSDQASLELLRHLVRRPPNGPVMVAIAYRTGTMPEGWQVLADAAHREGDLARLEVGPLQRGDAELLLGDRVEDHHLRAKLYEATGGNPFFMRQVAEAPQVVATINAAERGREGVPKAVVAAIAEEVAALEPSAREALQAAAIAGDPFDPDLAAAAAGVTESEMLSEVDELVRRGLIRLAGSPRRFQFRHPLVWQGVYEGAPPGWRLSAHRRLAVHLARQNASATARAPHVEAAAQRGDLESIAVLREAAEAAMAQAPASAIHWFGAALRLMPDETSSTVERISLLVPMAMALGSIGRLHESRDGLREAYALIPAEDEAGRVEVAVAWATMENLLRNLPEATRLLTGELGRLREPHSSHAASILLALSSLHAFSYEAEAARDWGTRALELAAALQMPALEAAAAATVAYDEAGLGRVSEARRLLERATSILDDLSPETASGYLDAFFWASVSEMTLERFEDSLHHANRAREVARATGQGRWLPQIAAVRAWAAYHLGRIEEAEQAAGEGAEMGQLTGNRQFESLVLAVFAVVMLPSGQVREALRAGERAIELAGSPADGDYISMYARLNAAVASLEAGDPTASRRLIMETMDQDGRPRVEAPWQALGFRTLSAAELALGNLEAADQWARRGADAAERLGLQVSRTWALQALTGVQLAQQQSSEAIRTARAASEAAAAVDARIERGRSLTLLGRALVADGDEAAGAAELTRAHELLQDCGAVRYCDVAARELRGLGIRVQRHPRRGEPHDELALSAREREIAELVAEGRSNKEIGAALFISPKTVEKHLSSAFEKLGVSKRAQVAAAIAREEEGLAPGEPGK